MQDETKALEVKNLSVILTGHRIINNISFSVEPGSTTAIIGPNGAGKSVLIKSILRLLPKEKGEIKIFGLPHEQYRKVASEISYIPQHFEYDRDFPLTVKGLFTLKSPRPIGMTSGEKKRMQGLLEKVGMTNHQDKKVSDLSGGQLQRVLIAYSLMDHPKLLILDEPAAGIDVQGQDTVYALLQKSKEEEHLTMILIRHELDVVMQYADQVLCLNQKLLCAGIPKKVLTNEILEKMYGTPVGHFTHDHHAKH